MSDMLESRCPKLEGPRKVFLNAVLPHLDKFADRDARDIYIERVEKHMDGKYKNKPWPFVLPTLDKDSKPGTTKENQTKPSSSKTIQPDNNFADTSNNGKFAVRINFLA
jgi:hypothetical protein